MSTVNNLMGHSRGLLDQLHRKRTTKKGELKDILPEIQDGSDKILLLR